MRYVAAYLLATLAGNQSPDLATLEKILSSAGIEVDKTKATKVIESLKGKSVEQLIKDGSAKLATMPAASAAPAAAAPAAGGAPAAAAKDEPSKLFCLFYFDIEKFRRLFYVPFFCESSDSRKAGA
jgi:large subunit ribosomal protein LP2